MPILALITRFVLAGAIGLGGALGVAAVTAPPASNLLPASSSFQLTADTGDQVVPFGLTSVPDETPITLRALPDDKTIQLVAFAEGEPSLGSDTRPAWLLPTGYPRVPPISQFDGGPLDRANCTMASGAMLARLGYGIVTTGSQLRALQPDQEGGTSLADLQVAIGRWGVSFSQGAISPIQLRALLYAGAGAVVQVTYGSIPASLRLQADFSGGHAIYLDGFRPAGTDGPAGYYVIARWPTGGQPGFLGPAECRGRGARLRRRTASPLAFPGGAPPPTADLRERGSDSSGAGTSATPILPSPLCAAPRRLPLAVALPSSRPSLHPPPWRRPAVSTDCGSRSGATFQGRSFQPGLRGRVAIGPACPGGNIEYGRRGPAAPTLPRSRSVATSSTPTRSAVGSCRSSSRSPTGPRPSSSSGTRTARPAS